MQLFKSLTILAALVPLALANKKPGPSVECGAYPSKPQEPAQKLPNHKITMLIKKLDNITYDYFYKYWNECDTPLALDCPAFRENGIKFVQTHNTPELKKQFADVGYPSLPYDGIVDIYVKDLEHWQKVTSSDCWQKLRVDAKTFTKWPYDFLYGSELLAFDKTKSRGPGPHYELA